MDRRPGEQHLPASPASPEDAAPSSALGKELSCASWVQGSGVGSEASWSQSGIRFKARRACVPVPAQECWLPSRLAPGSKSRPPQGSRPLLSPVSMGAQSGSQACLCSHPLLPPLSPAALLSPFLLLGNQARPPGDGDAECFSVCACLRVGGTRFLAPLTPRLLPCPCILVPMIRFFRLRPRNCRCFGIVSGTTQAARPLWVMERGISGILAVALGVIREQEA